jgi:8-oxo-dGTP pyrophosphatase MutT (NUDIX family)
MKGAVMNPDSEQRSLVSSLLVRRALHFYWRLTRGMTVGVRAILLDRDNRVFLVRHTYTWGWHFPGGGVEVGETALDALTREVREEGCIALTGVAHLHGVFLNTSVSRRDHVLVYLARDFEVLDTKRPDREIAEARFFPADALPAEIAPATKRRLDELLNGVAVAATW